MDKQKAPWKRRLLGLLLTAILYIGLSAVQLKEVLAKEYYDCDSGRHCYIVSIVEAAGEEHDGMRRYVCERCGYSYDEIIPRFGHVWGEWQVEKEASCTEEGLEVRYCTRYEHGDIREERATDKLEHRYGPWVVLTEPSSEKAGLEYRECIYGCGETQYRTVPAKNIPDTKVPGGLFTAVDGVLIGTDLFLFFVFSALILSDIGVLLWHSKMKKRTMEKWKNGESLYGE